MGNSNNDNFAAKMDMNEHRMKMAALSSQYSVNPNLAMPMSAPAPINQAQYSKIQRSNALYKTSITITVQAGELILNCDYDSGDGCTLHTYIGVEQVHQDDKNRTTQIISKKQFSVDLPVAKKGKISQRYPIQYMKLDQCSIILLLVCNVSNEKTEYSLRKATDGWKVLLEKYEQEGHVYTLDNLYKGGQSEANQDCIICMSAPSSTMIKPCNHLCLCQQCSVQVKKSTNNCPICRRPIHSMIVMSGV